MLLLFFFFNDTATTEIYTLSLHDALPISRGGVRALRRPDRLPVPRRARRHPRRGDPPRGPAGPRVRDLRRTGQRDGRRDEDRKSTRLNSSHANISYAVFCLKKKKKHRSEL